MQLHFFPRAELTTFLFEKGDGSWSKLGPRPPLVKGYPLMARWLAEQMQDGAPDQFNTGKSSNKKITPPVGPFSTQGFQSNIESYDRMKSAMALHKSAGPLYAVWATNSGSEVVPGSSSCEMRLLFYSPRADGGLRFNLLSPFAKSRDAFLQRVFPGGPEQVGAWLAEIFGKVQQHNFGVLISSS